ncbi:2OG-Fe(II) oxygenase family protein [Bradyrhizobium sp. HKCCYLS2038]|uniref:2OG-Fe(II) oxygenase family protein n=1 Tax=unclassified Bradyrhizobium TaxID=2631580 RepID=UPI003EBC6C08
MNRQLNVPRIDIGALRDGDPCEKLALARELDEICRGAGFFYVSGHGIDVRQLAEMTAIMHRTIPAQEKFDLAIKAYNPTNSRSRAGFYLAIEGKKAPESFCYLNPNFDADHPRIAAKAPMHEVNVWPRPRDGVDWRSFFESYYWQIFDLSQTILRGFALALGESEDFFARYFRREDTLSAVSLIRYPYLVNYPPLQTAPDGTVLSFGDHLDVSLITVLFQTPIPNLQVESAGGYLDVPVSGTDFLVNCGTYMAHLTNGLYPARRHRVVFINKERLSLPFFVNLGDDDAPTLDRPGGPHTRHGLAYGHYLRHGLGDLIVKNGQT